MDDDAANWSDQHLRMWAVEQVMSERYDTWDELLDAANVIVDYVRNGDTR